MTSAGRVLARCLRLSFSISDKPVMFMFMFSVMPPTTTCYSNEIREKKKNKRVSNIGIIVTQMEQVSDLMIQHCVYCHVMSFEGGWKAAETTQSSHLRGVHVAGRSWLHRIYCVLGAGSQLTGHTSSTTPTYLSLSSLVMVWRRAETPRDGSRHHVWLDSLVGPCAVCGAIR